MRDQTFHFFRADARARFIYDSLARCTSLNQDIAATTLVLDQAGGTGNPFFAEPLRNEFSSRTAQKPGEHTRHTQCLEYPRYIDAFATRFEPYGLRAMDLPDVKMVDFNGSIDRQVQANDKYHERESTTPFFFYHSRTRIAFV